MQFDDRLATALRLQAENERGTNTQYRQLLDLAGSAPEGASDELLGKAFARLEVLSYAIDADHRASMIREPGMRLRNLETIAFLAEQELPVASAAMAVARLNETQWDVLIPALPIPARALLRHRKDLPERTLELLSRLGVSDLVLPQPETERSELPQAPAAADTAVASDPVYDIDPALEVDSESEDGIGAIVRRIEAFQRARQVSPSEAVTDAPRLPMAELHDDTGWNEARSIDFLTDAGGRIIWAERDFAPMTVGIMLASGQAGAPAQADEETLAAFEYRQPIHDGLITLEGAPAIAGDWQIDAAPIFSDPGGSFTGYRGRLRRPAAATQQANESADTPAERMRQVLHELRTPVNAIQGFAELIQQQLFGPTPHEYRALAASIAGDAARMLAGFDELDRLAKLESGALELDEGSCDFRSIADATVSQLDAVLRQRTCGFEYSGPGAACPLALTQRDAESLAWRILATLAGTASAGEVLSVTLDHDGEDILLQADLPAALSESHSVFASSAPNQAQAVSAGMFGTGFSLRLARAEARAAGGDLYPEGDLLTLKLPLLLGNPDKGATAMGNSGARLAGAA